MGESCTYPTPMPTRMGSFLDALRSVSLFLETLETLETAIPTVSAFPTPKGETGNGSGNTYDAESEGRENSMKILESWKILKSLKSRKILESAWGYPSPSPSRSAKKKPHPPRLELRLEGSARALDPPHSKQHTRTHTRFGSLHQPP